MPASILIADDYEDNRELLRLMLEMSGHRVREARDGRECIEMARVEPPDLFLLDLSMPVLDGWGTLRELRADERMRGIPCIAVTAFAMKGDEEKIREGGCEAYISKPISVLSFLQVVDGFLKRPQ